MALPAGLCCFQQQKLTLSFIFFFLQQDCPSGRLTPAKFVDMYKMFFPNGNAEEFCDHVFRTFDRDKNGFIDFKVSVFSFSSCGGDQLVQVLENNQEAIRDCLLTARPVTHVADWYWGVCELGSCC